MPVLHLAQHVRDLVLQQRAVAAEAGAQDAHRLLAAAVPQREQRAVALEYVGRVVQEQLPQLPSGGGRRQRRRRVDRQVPRLVLEARAGGAVIKGDPLQRELAGLGDLQNKDKST